MFVCGLFSISSGCFVGRFTNLFVGCASWLKSKREAGAGMCQRASARSLSAPVQPDPWKGFPLAWPQFFLAGAIGSNDLPGLGNELDPLKETIRDGL